MRAPSKHWSEVARQWDQVGPPLKPSFHERAIFNEIVERWAREHGAPRALILGVTPELYHLPWPLGTTIVAVDHTPAMIEAVWPGPRNAVICADWTELPLAPGSQDIVLCDGGLTLLSYPRGHLQLIQALSRVVAADGLCVFRLYVPSAKGESAEEVLDDLTAGRISNPNILKLRLGMALQENSQSGVQLGHVWEVLHRAVPDLGQFAATFGWPEQPWLAIQTYRQCARNYHFLGLQEVTRHFSEGTGDFTLEMVRVPESEFGERCPIVAFRRRKAVGASRCA